MTLRLPCGRDSPAITNSPIKAPSTLRVRVRLGSKINQWLLLEVATHLQGQAPPRVCRSSTQAWFNNLIKHILPSSTSSSLSNIKSITMKKGTSILGAPAKWASSATPAKSSPRCPRTERAIPFNHTLWRLSSWGIKEYIKLQEAMAIRSPWILKAMCTRGARVLVANWACRAWRICRLMWRAIHINPLLD